MPMLLLLLLVPTSGAFLPTGLRQDFVLPLLHLLLSLLLLLLLLHFHLSEHHSPWRVLNPCELLLQPPMLLLHPRLLRLPHLVLLAAACVLSCCCCCCCCCCCSLMSRPTELPASPAAGGVATPCHIAEESVLLLRLLLQQQLLLLRLLLLQQLLLLLMLLLLRLLLPLPRCLAAAEPWGCSKVLNQPRGGCWGLDRQIK